MPPPSSRRSKSISSASDVLSVWDKGSKLRRIQILTQFISTYRDSTGAEIERALGSLAVLFFGRVTAWLRLTYQLGYELSLQLGVVALFLQGQRFLVNFSEIGGIQTLLDMLCMPSLKSEDKQNVLLLLIHAANCGRVYREMLCDCSGIDLIVHSFLHETDEQTLELFGSLFMATGQGNPNKASVVHAGLVYTLHEGDEPACLTAATVLRSLQMSAQYYTTSSKNAMFPSITASNCNRRITSAGGTMARINVTEKPPSIQSAATRPPSASREPSEDAAGTTLLLALFSLLRRESVKLVFEGTELLVIAARNPSLVSRVVRGALQVIQDGISKGVLEAGNESFISDSDSAEPWGTLSSEQRQQAACARLITRLITGDTDSQWMDRQQVKEVHTLLESENAPQLLLQLLCVASAVDVGTQRECANAVMQMCVAVGGFLSTKILIRQMLGSALYDEFIVSVGFLPDALKNLREILSTKLK